MASKAFDDILRGIRNRQFHQVYFLMGEEVFFIDVISDYLEETVLNEQEKEFNLTILYGKDTDARGIINTAKRFPMMADYHLVIIKEAQNIRDLEDLVSYMNQPSSSTILVISYKHKSYDRRKKLIREIEKVGVVYEAKRLYDNQVPAWITDYVKRRGYKIGVQAVQVLADHLGNDLGKIVNEVGKVFININKGGEITPALIEAHIGISKDFNIYEFQQALINRNPIKAFQIARYFADNPKSSPLPLTLGSLYQLFSRVLIYHSLKDKSRKNVAKALSVNEFFVDQYQKAAKRYNVERLIQLVAFLREYDNKSKGIGNTVASDGELLKELTFKLLR